MGAFPILDGTGTTPRISSLLIKPASAVCNLDCSYCFYLDREADPYQALPARRMTLETLERLVDTFLFYSYPASVFAFQGGEPTLAGLPFFESLVEFQKQYGRNGQAVINSLQTNGILLDEPGADSSRRATGCWAFRSTGRNRRTISTASTRQAAGTWRKVIRGIEWLQKNGVEFNVLCVLSQANVGQPEGALPLLPLARDRAHSVHSACRIRRPGQSAALHDHARTIRAVPVRDLRAVVAGPDACASASSTTSPRRWPARSPAPAPCTKPATATWWWSITATSTRAISSWRRTGSSAT